MAGVADLIMQSDVEYDSISIVYNKFLSAISYEPAIIKVANKKILKESRQSFHSPSYLLTNHLPAGFHAYEMEDDFTKDFAEFRWPTLPISHSLKLMPVNRALGQ